MIDWFLKLAESQGVTNTILFGTFLFIVRVWWIVGTIRRDMRDANVDIRRHRAAIIALCGNGSHAERRHESLEALAHDDD